MKLGTQDANIYYHAGMIYYRLGDPQQARQYLRQALHLNPHFSLRHADQARSILKKLGAKPATAGGERGAAQ
jgi:Tfp pilus assembly protein PilF